ncbi:Helix-turn-helix [Lutibacter oricola]|uniref:Helix-turn-helix n=1 Tax=Lutibacter oricola TaxID=762486 RepID=A0A1H2XEJ5_9FLAO|nr:helix-turn-helix transcriptional regulator [Lutibacter oricola]SDW90689.1 Helix-turn-helix [Lutibacter oricola]
MVNIDEFSKRLKLIMETYSYSASSFAQKLEVQRSSISHLLSGRNKPSLDFVLKVLKVFPEVELYWLLNGVGSFPKKESEPVTTLFSNTEKKEEFVPEKIIEKTEKEIPVEVKISEKKEIERIVVFFKDGSFKNYTP